MTTIDKDAARIEKEKAALVSVKGAEANMRTVIDRVATLETALKEIRGRCEELNKAFNTDFYMRIWYDSKHQPMPINDVFKMMINTATRVL